MDFLGRFGLFSSIVFIFLNILGAHHERGVLLNNLMVDVAKLDDEADQVRVQRVHKNHEMTFGEYAQRWFVHMQQTGRRRPHTLERKLQNVELSVLPYLAHLRLVDLGKPELASWMAKLPQKQKRNGEAYSKQTFNTAWNTLRTMLRDAEMLVGIPCSASDNMRFSVKAPQTTTPHDTLNREELVAMLKETDNEKPDIKAMIWILATTGVRFGELAGLHWDDIDEENRLIHIRRSAVAGVAYPTKTSVNRTVPLYENMLDILKEHRAWLDDELFRNREERVFPSRVGSFRYPSVLHTPLSRCAKRAGLEKHVTPQALRRTVNNLIRQTAGEIAARAITGHASQAMTEHYSDVTMEEKHRAGQNALGREVIGEAR
ncbi:MAG: tyrosine-type recombinase/integrase [Deltaproteobacteria bacterium]|nr:tyrosine-type recombinase/integrase [Deltaproteobacteria bacterium]